MCTMCVNSCVSASSSHSRFCSSSPASGGESTMPMKLNGRGEASPLAESSESTTTICVRVSGFHRNHPVMRGYTVSATSATSRP